jgi:predicted ATPase
MEDGRLLMQIKDAPFEHPVLARFASDGTLKMLAYLVLLYDPQPPPFIGIEEPENFLHPRLLPALAEECRNSAAGTQLFVTTHSPCFINALRPNELRVLWRDGDGFTRVTSANEIQGIPEFVHNGALLGHLWMEGFFGVGDPLLSHGAPTQPRQKRKS